MEDLAHRNDQEEIEELHDQQEEMQLFQPFNGEEVGITDEDV